MLRDSLPDSLFGREDAEKGELTAAHDGLTVNQHRELAIVPGDRLDRNAKLAAQVGCHPGSLNGRHSISTTTDRYRHVVSDVRSTATVRLESRSAC